MHYAEGSVARNKTPVASVFHRADTEGLKMLFKACKKAEEKAGAA